jgi:hypothetical protein
VIPGDIVVADDDGAVVVPAKLAEACIAKARKDHEWEDFSREMLARGGDLRRYYPLSDAARPEYEAWKAQRGARSVTLTPIWCARNDSAVGLKQAADRTRI